MTTTTATETETTKIETQYNPIEKDTLKQLSTHLKTPGGVCDANGLTVNEALIAIYEKTILGLYEIKVQNWNTFHGWKKEGYKVKKGSKGFRVWSKPKKVAKSSDNQYRDLGAGDAVNEDEKSMKVFRTAVLFCDAQVEEM